MKHHKKPKPKTLTATGVVRDMASDGRGIIAGENRKITFVPGVWVGEEICYKMTGKKSNVSFGEVIEVLQPSPHRIQAPCSYHGSDNKTCGGCPWMYVDYQEQLRAKQNRVENSISRLSPKTKVKPIIGSNKVLGYRNRAQFKSNGKEIGFVASGTNQLIPIEQCLVLEDINNQTLNCLRQKLPNPDWQPKKKDRKSPQWATLDIDVDTPPEQVSINQRLPFRQANEAQNQQMKAWLKTKLKEISPSGKIIEFFCGSGNFTEVLASNCSNNIIAVEVIEEAVCTLRSKNWPNVDVEIFNLFDRKGFESFCQKHQDAELLFLDPPRDGLQIKDGLFTKKSRLKDILYISCDLATLTRDINFFIVHGFVLEDVQPIDLFPQTPHIEIMVHLHLMKKNKKQR